MNAKNILKNSRNLKIIENCDELVEFMKNNTKPNSIRTILNDIIPKYSTMI